MGRRRDFSEDLPTNLSGPILYSIVLPLGNWDCSVNGVWLINGTREGELVTSGEWEEADYMEQLMRL